jgi:spermidine synthase
VVTRNFYSQLRVRESDEDDGLGRRRVLLHGIIDHGGQFLTQPLRMQPTSYFCPDTGVGRAMSQNTGKPRRIGILGLGCGNLVAYGRAGDLIRLYEINPQVLQLARSEFSYLTETPARIETVLGDGRLSLEREPNQQFDILVLDAFSGDSVPVHLITEEAFVTYKRHLRKGGILAVNVTNKYLDLGPVMERVASRFGWKSQLYDFDPDELDNVCNGVTWVLLTEPARYAELPAELKQGEKLEVRNGFRLWTDDFSNMLGILK